MLSKSLETEVVRGKKTRQISRARHCDSCVRILYQYGETKYRYSIK